MRSRRLFSWPKSPRPRANCFDYSSNLKASCPPLLFFSIVDALITTNIRVGQGLKLILLSSRNAAVALIISFSLSHLIPAQNFLNTSAISRLILSQGQLVPPSSPLGFLGKIDILTFIFIALIVGTLFRLLKVTSLEPYFASALRWNMRILGVCVRFVPLAVFGIVAKVVGVSGFSAFSSLLYFVLLVSSGIFIHVFIYYSVLIYFSLKKNPEDFFRQGSAPLLTALATGSSLASLPVTLPTLQDKMGVSPASARLAACVGTNLNHDGIILYEVTAALFIAQVAGQTLTFIQMIKVASAAIMAAVGIAGIPEAGLITLSLVLGSVGLPASGAAFLLPVDWLLGRLRAFTNVASDMIVAHLLD